ncbi:MAG: hypothetical protein CVV32_06255 [Methanomicrobiales archaeon HGW-Methanomicrobiales-3]|jgi:hypothetical protein|nr:MAG: hypothetical protein CVV32_06255 [Methanomicrobiales archaeon HGW-Methanomicrobiales-3]
MLKAKDLIQYGYFPSELPPSFHTITLGEFASRIPLEQYEKWQQEWQKINSKINRPESKCVNYSVPRYKNFRRVLSIPNPFYQMILCNQIEKNWKNIKQHIRKSPISITRPVIPIQRSKKNSRAFDQVRHTISNEQEIALRSTEFSFALKTDISRYYPTIYTHSISWALHGKDEAKKKRNSSSLYGNDLDKCVRSTRDGQTLGIPIGPDTSLIIAEILTNAVDVELEHRIGKKLHGLRVIDDYLLFFKEKCECEIALECLHEIFKEFELEMNPIKIQILELPYVLEPIWKPTIKLFNFRVAENRKNNYSVQRSDLINFFSRVNDFCKLFPETNIMKYAVKRIHNISIFEDNLPLFESLLLKSILTQSSCIPDVAGILKENQNKKYVDKKERIGRTISEIIRIHTKYANHHEISWALWLAKEFEINIDKSLYPLLSKQDNPVVVLLALDLRDHELISDDIDESRWKKFLVRDQLYDDHWLLTYEAANKEWLLPSTDYLESDPFFKALKDNEVSFYDTTKSEILSIPGPSTSGF